MSRARRLSLDDRAAEAFDDLSRDEQGGLHSDSLLIVLVSDPGGAAWPVIPGCFFPVQRVQITGTPSTGSLATLTPAGAIFFAWNRGVGIPPDPATPATTYLIADEAGGRWTIEYNG